MKHPELKQLIKEEIRSVLGEIHQRKGESDDDFSRRSYTIQTPLGALSHMLITYQSRLKRVPKKNRVYGKDRYKKYAQEIFDLLGLGQAPPTEKEAIKILTDKYGPSHFHNGGKWTNIVSQNYSDANYPEVLELDLVDSEGNPLNTKVKLTKLDKIVGNEPRYTGAVGRRGGKEYFDILPLNNHRGYNYSYIDLDNQIAYLSGKRTKLL